jgi:hypothetical protein
MTPTTIPPDVAARHEREARDKIADDVNLPKDGFIWSVAFMYYRDAARSEYTRLAGEVERLKEKLDAALDCYSKCRNREVEVKAERDALRAELEAARSRIAELEDGN